MRKVLFVIFMLLCVLDSAMAQQRRPIDSRHPMWLVHIDVWNKADPQKIINLIPTDIRPYVVLNLSMSCAYDIERNVHRMPENAVLTYRSWATVCQQNGMWFTCQPASGGHTHLLDNDLETFEYFFKTYPNFLGWNFAEQFWGFDELNDKYSSSVPDRMQLFANLIRMSHKYGGFLTVSFCGNIWSHQLNPVGMLRSCPDLLEASREYPEAILWLYKYTTSSCFYNNESVSFGPFVAGLANNYGVRYDNCGWNGALESIYGQNNNHTYPTAAGLGTVMEQTCQNGGAVWDGPELIWTEDFQNLSNTVKNGYTQRNWGTFQGFRAGWLDMFRKIITGAMYIPTRQEVVENTKVVVINNSTSGDREEMYAAWNTLYDGLYKQSDPFNKNSGYWMDNLCYFKQTGRYRTIPIVPELHDDLAKAIPLKVEKPKRNSVWPTNAAKVNAFNALYPEQSKGDLFVSRFKNQLVTYTPYSYLNAKTTATAIVPLEYNTCESMELTWGKLSSGLVKEYADHIDFYLNNFRNDTTAMTVDRIVIKGATAKPTYKITRHSDTNGSSVVSESWDEVNFVYTAEVKHNGPVDVTINASGAATDRKTDVLPTEALEMPKQPEAYTGMVIKEAEDMDYADIKDCVTDPFNWYPDIHGHAGNGFMNMGSKTSASLRATFKMADKGAHRIAIRYTSPRAGGKMKVAVGVGTKEVEFEKTEYSEWRNAVVEFTTTTKSPQVTITNTSGVEMYIDQVSVTPADIPEETWAVTVRETEHGTATASVSEAAEGTVVTLDATPAEGYRLAGWEIVHGKVTITEEGTFKMPNDNVTLIPIFLDSNLVYDLNVDKVLTGNVPEGWELLQGTAASDSHKAPNTYESGARTMSGFFGKYRKAVYWRGKYASLGRIADKPFHLKAGKYVLSFTMAAWKSAPAFKAVIAQLSPSKMLASSAVLTASPNANGDGNADISTAKENTLEFTIATEGDYVVQFNATTGGSGDEFLLTSCCITEVPDPSSVKDAVLGCGINAVSIYNEQGIEMPSMQPGFNIVVGADGRVHKYWMK